MAISSAGIGSGLDVNSIITQLMEIEQQPLLNLEQQEAEVYADISAYGTLKGALSSLQTSIAGLQDADTFQATAATSSDSDVITVSSDTSAAASSYAVTVNRLAQQHKLGSVEQLSNATFGGGANDALTLTVGSDSFTLDLSTAKSLEEIQSAINADSNTTGVTAGLITGDNGKQTLVLTADESGYDNRVQLSYGGAIDANTFGFTTINRDASGVQFAPGSEQDLDASLTIDGVTVTRSSNSISDAVAGLTLTLTGVGQATASIGRDTDVATSAVENFITAYNDLDAQMSTLSQSMSSSSILRNIESQLRNVLNSGQSGVGDYGYISELGVTTREEGGLELDSDMLLSALNDHPDSVISFFTDETSGFGARLDGMLEGFLESDGVLDSMVDTANSQISRIETSKDSLERRLETTEARLRSQFTALDTLMAEMNTTSSYLTSQLDMLSNLASGNNN